MSAPSEDKWLLLGILNNTIQSYALLVVLLLPTKLFVGVFLTDKAYFK